MGEPTSAHVARLDDEERHALDLLLAAGGVGPTPAAVPRDRWGGHDPAPAARHPRLRARLAAIEASARVVGDARWYAGHCELLAIASAPPPAAPRSAHPS
ncbi:MAG: hypothetical protein MUF83_18160 [Acidimicrobiales bacterium]|jgi:hypothetical protein|nr:hypothetical protein [Acidimicrobiales bacterium]